jgi:drug/metabolite transporter (DMT)-like permease
MPDSAQQTTITTRAWLLMCLLALIWGGSFLSNRVALTEVGVFTIVAFRVSGAALLLWIYVALRGLPVPRDRRALGVFALLGLTNNAIPFTLIVWGQQHIASGLASILNSATAVMTVLLVTLVFPDERLTIRKAIGVGLGFAGVATAIGLSHLTSFDPTSLGQLAVLGASLAYALSAAFARAAFRGMRPEVAAAGMLTAAGFVMVPLALWLDGAPKFAYGATTWMALAYLAFIASALAYMLYYTVLVLAGAGNLSLVTLLIPPVAIILGAVTYGEALHMRAYVGFAFLAIGLLIIDGRAEKLLRHRTGTKNFREKTGHSG